MTTGKIGVSTQDLFPIIKKFLYSDHDIFLREIVSNAVDATQKLKVLASSGEYAGELGDVKIQVKADKEAGTLTVSDRGIGMTREEVEKYINQIAFSGAEEFLAQHKDDAATIIGHFGLGFYSAFMVSNRVDIVTKSYKDGSQAVKWSCSGDPEYTLEDVEKEERGTDIVMHINEEDKDFLEDGKISELLNKYCKFLPVEIVFGKKKEWKDGKQVDTDEDHVINDVNPAWTRKPSDLKEEDYLNFYHQLYPMAEDPLFHIHLNVDYPFNLTGILYFPKINNKFEIQKNKIQLYSNQVYVTDSVEGIVPEYLTLLHGVIDSPDIPLNVSRSYLQSDRNVKKISSHITKKVADSIEGLYKNERKDFETKWDDLKIFIQYGMLTDEKFAERAEKFYLLKNTDGKYYGLEEYVSAIKEQQTDRDNKVVFLYAQASDDQYAYIQAAKAKGYDVLIMDGSLETPFINFLEQKHSDWRFVRVDSDVADRLIPKADDRKLTWTAEQQKRMRGLFDTQLPKTGGMYHVELQPMGEEAEPVLVARSEYMRRMKEMAEINPEMSFYGQMGDQLNIVVNTDHRLIKAVLERAGKALDDTLNPLQAKVADLQKQKKDIEDLSKDLKEADKPASDKDRIDELQKQIAEVEKEEREQLRQYAAGDKTIGQLIDLALLSNGLLKGEALHTFVKRSVDMID